MTVRAAPAVAAPGPVLRVELSDGGALAFEVPAGRTLIGRGASCGLILRDEGISREHAALVRDGAALRLEDLGSTNGTRVNGERLDGPRELRAGDLLAVGRARLTVQDPAAAAAATFLRDAPLIEHVVRDGVDPASLTLAAPAAEAERWAGEGRTLQLLYQLGRVLDPDVEVGELARRVLELADHALAPERCVLRLGDGGPDARELVADHGAARADRPAAPRALAAAAVARARAGQAVLAVDGAGAAARAVVCVPIRGRDAAAAPRVLGWIYADAPGERPRWSPRDLDLLQILANHAGAVVTTARAVAALRRDGARLVAENTELRDELRERARIEGLLGDSDRMREVVATIHKVAPTDATVLITGESGTGKEVVARAIHALSPRAAAPFVAINCAAIPAELLEAELFGIEKGVATGVDRRAGRFEQAGDGTLLLDELGELPLVVQAKLLRVLEAREVERVGGRAPIKVRARILAATNRGLAAEVAAGRFREDLYYRLHVVPLRLPPLRERPTDVPVLAAAFVRRVAAAQGRRIAGFTPEALDALCAYRWPGNVRELLHEVERVVTVGDPGPDGRIGRDQLGDAIQHGPAESPRFVEELEVGDIKDAIAAIVERAETHMIRRALAASGGNRAEAARALGLTREGLRKKMLRHGLGDA